VPLLGLVERVVRGALGVAEVEQLLLGMREDLELVGFFENQLMRALLGCLGVDDALLEQPELRGLVEHAAVPLLLDALLEAAVLPLQVPGRAFAGLAVELVVFLEGGGVLGEEGEQFDEFCEVFLVFEFEEKSLFEIFLAEVGQLQLVLPGQTVELGLGVQFLLVLGAGDGGAVGNAVDEFELGPEHLAFALLLEGLRLRECARPAQKVEFIRLNS
jgi:hypothetical protein